MPPAKAAAGRPGAKGKGGKTELTEEQKQEIREAFDLFDTDGSGAPRSQPPASRSWMHAERRGQKTLAAARLLQLWLASARPL